MLRRLILAAADSPRVQRFVAKYGMRLGAARFVAGETLEEAVVTLGGLNEQGLRTNTTLLGEFVHEEAEAASVVRTYEEVLRRIEDTTLLYGMSQIVLAIVFILIIIFRREGLLGQRELALDRLFAKGGERSASVTGPSDKVAG